MPRHAHLDAPDEAGANAHWQQADQRIWPQVEVLQHDSAAPHGHTQVATLEARDVAAQQALQQRSRQVFQGPVDRHQWGLVPSLASQGRAQAQVLTFGGYVHLPALRRQQRASDPQTQVLTFWEAKIEKDTD